MPKSILITGASSGIGKQLAINYAQQGEHVIACGRNEVELQALHQAFPDNIQIISFDVNDRQQTTERLLQIEGKLDIVILNAGVCEYVDIDHFDAALFQRTFDTNVIGAMAILEILLPKLPTQSQLVFVSSSSAYMPMPRAAAYGGSKAALTYIAYSLATQLKPRKIAVSVVHSGFIDTPLTRKNDFPMPMLISTEQAAEKIIAGIAARKLDIHFPWIFTSFIKLIGMLPRAVQLYLGQKMVNK